MLKYTRDAVVRNLNIQGERIEGNGLLLYYTVDYGEDGLYNTGVPDTITIENCHIIGKTNITKSGFLGGYASGSNRIVISNCSVGKDVVIGCDKDQGPYRFSGRRLQWSHRELHQRRHRLRREPCGWSGRR